ncbi:MAG: glycosyl hydrolase [Verrucomicrobiales bacterium]|nr:glycosyl hydrolase [Verrucomicrobiales bacterium]|tara:strand:+ start:15998 stop:16681 length:684 start_codon:yes stop_codon:yes gene_type:complete
MKIYSLLLMPILGTLALATVEAEEGFIELFNGENLDGWTPSKENPDSYSVKDGKLIVKGGRSHLFYTGDVQAGKFKDFELKVRAKTFPGANSGVYFHSEYQNEGWPNKGYECQVNSTHKDPKKTGSLYGVINILVLAEGQKQPKGGKHIERDKAPSTDGEWFDYHIIVKGRDIEIRVNGETTVKYSEPKGGPDTVFGGRRLSEGTFAIQAHDPDSEVHYERWAVKPL